MSILGRDDNKLLLELYKELGLEVRQRNSETYATNRLMLPPLVIGLLVLYGKVEKFLGVEFDNPEAIHRLVWFGCVVISLLWICNMSRLAQLSHWHLGTQRECEHKLGLIGHKKIAKKDAKREKQLPILKILRHSRLRFVGFWIYFTLLISFGLKNVGHYLVEIFTDSSINNVRNLSLWVGSFLLSGLISWGMTYCIWSLYFEKPSQDCDSTSSENAQ